MRSRHYSLEELRDEEKRIRETLKKEQTNEPSRKNKTKYDFWVRRISYHVDELRYVRDEIEKRLEVGSKAEENKSIP